MIVKKKNNEIRLCGDFRPINNILENEEFPIPKTNELLASFNKPVEFIAKLDLNNAFHQLRISDASQKFATIRTHCGCYKYKRLPFGIKTAPILFQKFISKLLFGLKGVLVYMDDLLVIGENEENFLENLRTVLEKLNSEGLKLNTHKCTWLEKRVKWLGHILSKEGFAPDPQKVEAIERLETPRNKKELRMFIGMIGFYEKFIENFAKLANPLYRLLKDNVKFCMTPIEIKSVIKLKNSLKNAVNLNFFRPGQGILKLKCDASFDTISAILEQEKEKDVFAPLFFLSKKLTKREENFTIGEKEALTIIFAVEKLRNFLLGSHFIIETDHSSLTTMLTTGKNKISTARINSWKQRLGAFDFEIKYKCGNENVPADALTRLPAIFNKEMENFKSKDLVILNVDQAENWRNLIIAVQNDEWTENAKTKFKEFHLVCEKLKVIGGQLYYKERFVPNEEVRKEILRRVHLSHNGIRKTYLLLAQLYWWPKMKREITNIINSCVVCQRSQRTIITRKTTLKV